MDEQGKNSRASCCCGALSLVVSGEPHTVSVCHCLECKRRTGSVLGAQVRFANERVTISGQSKVFERTGDTGAKVAFHFCADCGTTLYWYGEKLPGFTAVALGAFESPGFRGPDYSVYETRQSEWIELRGDMEHYD